MVEKTIISFLRKEPMATKVSNTDGYKLFFYDTVMAQWKDHRVLVNNTSYDDKDMNKFISALLKWVKNSDIIYQLCTKPVHVNAKNLQNFI